VRGRTRLREGDVVLALGAANDHLDRIFGAAGATGAVE